MSLAVDGVVGTLVGAGFGVVLAPRLSYPSPAWVHDSLQLRGRFARASCLIRGVLQRSWPRAWHWEPEVAVYVDSGADAVTGAWLWAGA